MEVFLYCKLFGHNMAFWRLNSIFNQLLSHFCTVKFSDTLFSGEFLCEFFAYKIRFQVAKCVLYLMLEKFRISPFFLKSTLSYLSEFSTQFINFNKICIQRQTFPPVFRAENQRKIIKERTTMLIWTYFMCLHFKKRKIQMQNFIISIFHVLRPH